MGTTVDKASVGPLLGRGSLLAAVAIAVYWGVAWSLTLLPGEPLALGLRPLWVGLALLAYVVFAYDYVALFATYRDAYPGVRHRTALLAGAQVGTLTFKVLMMVIWFALSQALPLIGLMLLFASTQLLKVAEFSVADAEQMRMLRALVAAPNRLLAPRAVLKGWCCMFGVLRGLFYFDGAIFTLVGMVVLVFPSARAAALPAAAGDTPHLRDTRRLLASAYIAAGLFLLSCGTGLPGEAYLRVAAVMRAVSLLVLVGVNVGQIQNGNWKPATLRPYVVAFPLMALAYLALAALA